MSSFVVSKSEYIKAAGFVAGLAEASKQYSKYPMWVFDHESNRNSTADDYKRNFAAMYKLNALSVQEQYDDDKPENDTNDYNYEFLASMRLGKRIYIGTVEERQRALHILDEFISCCLYQTENDVYSAIMGRYFNGIFRAVYAQFFPNHDTVWGDFNAEYIATGATS